MPTRAVRVVIWLFLLLAGGLSWALMRVDQSIPRKQWLNQISGWWHKLKAA